MQNFRHSHTMRYIPLIITMFALCSCASKRELIYFQNAPLGESVIEQNYELRIQKDDLLSISIASHSPELVEPFMQYSSSSATTTDDSTSPDAESERIAQYLVNSDGEITMPILGSIQVERMTHKELATHIEKLIKEGGYINDAVVRVRLDNFKVTMLGEIDAQVLEIKSDRVSIFEALSMAGDMSIMGLRDVSVVRESDGVRTIGKVNLHTDEVFASEFYYLQPNDIIYIQPNRKAQRASTSRPETTRNSATILSVILSAITLFTLL